MKLTLLKNPKTLALGAILILAGWTLGALFSGGGHDHGSSPAGGEQVSIWTCSMHPQIQQPKPGKCPICAMDLIPLKKGGSGKDNPRQLVMTESARQLAKITTVSVERRFVDAEIRLVGKVAFDETSTKTVAAYFPARIDRLYVDYTGISVRKGDHLAQVYSPELLTAQSELISALRFGSNVKVARDKLRLWGLSAERIRSIESNQETTDRLDIDSPLGGIVIQKHVSEGDYVKTGQPLFMIADLSKVWVMLEAYESDLPWLRYGQPVEFTAEAVPGRTFEGIVSFVSPTLDPKTRTIRVRVNAENPNEALKPDMFVHATVRATLAGEGKVIAPALAGKWISPMHPEIVRDEPGDCPVCGMALVKAEDLDYTGVRKREAPLVVPAAAVLRTGRRAVVYVEVPDQAQPTYEGREILVGPRAGGDYIVEEGLMEGERVVAQGNFKIDSALQIVAKPSMMNPNGGGGSGGHDHGGPRQARGEHKMLTYDVSPEFEAQLTTVYKAYLELQRALVASDLEKAKTAANSVAVALAKVDMNLLDEEAHLEWMNQLAPIRGSADLIASAKDIELARVAFSTLSQTLIRAAHVFALAPEKSLVHAHCPMAFDNKGGDWLQLGDEIRNPYFGDKMLNCGDVKATISAQAEKPDQYAADPNFQAQLGAVVQAYEAVSTALAEDDLAKAKSATTAVGDSLAKVDMALLEGDAHMAWMAHLEPLKTAAAHLAGAKDLKTARVEFKALSDTLISSLRSFGLAGIDQIFRAHCPMAFDNQGGDWLQLGEEIRNPYFGAAMLKCGSVEETLVPSPKESHDHGK